MLLYVHYELDFNFKGEIFMKLHELIKIVNFEDVKTTLMEVYDEKHTIGYEKVFCDLLILEPKESNDNMRIIVSWTEPDERFDEEGYWHVSGQNGKKYVDEEESHFLENASDEYKNSEVSYALDFTSWPEWLGMEVDEISFETLTCEQVCGHILWEMTFHGFENSKILEKRDDLLERVEEIKEGKTGTLIDIDELKSMLDEMEDEEE